MLYSGKRVAGQKYLISFLSVLLNYLFASLASISINFFPIATHANCATYDPHYSLLYSFFQLICIASLYQTFLISLWFCMLCPTTKETSLFIKDLYHLLFSKLFLNNHFLYKIFRFTPLAISTIYSFIC